MATTSGADSELALVDRQPTLFEGNDNHILPKFPTNPITFLKIWSIGQGHFRFFLSVDPSQHGYFSNIMFTIQL